jgi:RNA polymerase sigma-70 factor (ECF subfamily)
MATDLDWRTSPTLLERLHDPSDRSAWDEFATYYGGLIRGWCLRWGLQEADADEVTQQLLADIHAKMSRFTYDPARGRFRGWLRTLTHRACANLFGRRRLRSFEELQDSIPARTDLGPEEPDGPARRELLHAALTRVEAQVKPRDWQIFQALTLAGRSGKEVAANFAMTVAAALMVKSRVLKKLKEQVRELGGSDLEEELSPR